MSSGIYKYVGATYLDKVLDSDDRVTLKCSYPRQFNDPYELFLTIDFREGPEALAYYREVMGDIPQVPTTCFSRSPVVLPMWAHYAENLQGFSIEFDEEKLADAFLESGFGDIDYRDGPDESLTDMLYRAMEIGKPRYIYMLRRGVFTAAYYTKATCWSYEQERRMLVRKAETRESDGLVLMDVPADCVTALICGPRASEATKQILQRKAQQFSCRYYELAIGKTSPLPFLVDSKGEPSIFDGLQFVGAKNWCGHCKEPISEGEECCSWCQIHEGHQREAASRNTYRMLASYGLLDEYINGMNDISRRFEK